MAEKTEFKTVETSQEDLEELEEKIRRHRHKIARRTALVIVTVVAAVIFVELWSALRTYSGFEVQASAERKDSAATGYKMFQGKILEYDNDGIVCHDTDDRLIWNQSYEMTAPFSSFKMTRPSCSILAVTRLSPSDMVKSRSGRTMPSASFVA